jgi:sorbitol-specific phosphotransferase system component IIC
VTLRRFKAKQKCKKSKEAVGNVRIKQIKIADSRKGLQKKNLIEIFLRHTFDNQEAETIGQFLPLRTLPNFWTVEDQQSAY